MSVTTDETHDAHGRVTVLGLWRDYLAKLRGGDVGSLPAVASLVGA